MAFGIVVCVYFSATKHIMPLQRGQSVLLRYLDGGSWFERVIVLHSHGHEYWVLSPEFDLFPAILRVPPLSAVRLLPPS